MSFQASLYFCLFLTCMLFHRGSFFLLDYYPHNKPVNCILLIFADQKMLSSTQYEWYPQGSVFSGRCRLLRPAGKPEWLFKRTCTTVISSQECCIIGSMTRLWFTQHACLRSFWHILVHTWPVGFPLLSTKWGWSLVLIRIFLIEWINLGAYYFCVFSLCLFFFLTYLVSSMHTHEVHIVINTVSCIVDMGLFSSF